MNQACFGLHHLSVKEDEVNIAVAIRSFEGQFIVTDTFSVHEDTVSQPQINCVAKSQEK